MATPPFFTYSGVVYIGTGSQVEFALTSSAGKPIGYLLPKHISVSVSSDDGATWTVLDTPADYTFSAQGTRVVLTTAPVVDDWVRIKRTTPMDDNWVDYQSGNLLTAGQLNEFESWQLYIDQELEDRQAFVDGSTPGKAVKSVTGTAPIEVDNTNAQAPVISIDETKAADDPNALTSDTRVVSEAAIDAAFKQFVGTGPATTKKTGQLRIDDTGAIPTFFYWNGSVWVQLPTKGDKGDTGSEGPTGPAPGLQTPPATATNVPVKEDGTVGDATATVEQDGDGDLQFRFGIPVGETGSQGVQGNAATVDAGTATSLGYAQQPTVNNSGSKSAAVFNFGIPKGEPQKIVTQDAPPTSIAGEPVKDGDLWLNTQNGQLYVYYTDADSSQWVSVSKTGVQGPAATVDVASTTTLPAGSPASVVNEGTTSAALFRFSIPRGDKGEPGDPGSPGQDGADSTVPGPAGTVEVGTTQTLNPGSQATVTNTGSPTAAILNFGIPRGEKGQTGLTGPIGPTATVNAGTATSVSYKDDPFVTNTGSPAAAVFNFGIPKGAPQRCLIQDTPPSAIDGNAVEDGDTWYSSNNGQLYVYYDDGDSKQWVSVSKQGPPGVATVSNSPPNSPQIGELFFDENVNRLKIYTSTGWKYTN